MTVTSSTQVINVPPDMTLDQFSIVLIQGSALTADDINKGYQAVTKWKVSPAFALACFWHESKFGKVGICAEFNTRSPGNTRTSFLGKGAVIPTPKGGYVQYDTWADGFEDMAARLVGKPDYKGLTTIGQILPVFAPVTDGNSPDVYIKSVIDSMNQWASQGGNSMTAVPTQTDIGYPVRTHWAFDTGPNRALNTVNTFVVHDTEGGMASDEQVLTANDSNIASTHALVAPDGTLVFMVPLETTAWTPGNDAVAEKSINIEISGFALKGYTDAQYRSVAAFFNWCINQGCPIPATYVGKSGTAGILGHQDVPNPYQPGKFGGASGHTDPGPLFDWAKLVNYIKQGSKINVNVNQGPVTPKPFNPNPLNKNVGAGVLETLTREGMTAITNENYYVPDGNKPGLSKMSFTYADKGGVTYRVEAIQDLDADNQPLPTWKMQLWQFVKAE